jgi:hypothetical protein
VLESGWKRWPARLPEQPIFYPVLTREYAERIAREWNTPREDVGYVTHFRVSREFLDRYSVRPAGSRDLLEYWIPAEDLESFNNSIVGEISLVGSFGVEP